jgi:hypothetical protein
MSKLRTALLSLLQSDLTAIEVQDLRLVVIENDPLRVTEDFESFFELADLQPIVSDQSRFFAPSQGVCVHVYAGQLVYKKIPHVNQWFWDLHAEPSMLRCEPIPQPYVRPDIRPVSENPLVQRAQGDRGYRESIKTHSTVRVPAFSPNKYYSPDKPAQSSHYFPPRASNPSPPRYSSHAPPSYPSQASAFGAQSSYGYGQAGPSSASSLGFPAAASQGASLYPAPARKRGSFGGADSGKEGRGQSSNYRQRDNRMLEDLKAAVKAGMIKWDDIVFTQETIKYAKENFARLVSELDAQ